MTATLPPGTLDGAPTPSVRPAARHHRPGWRDPRILVGLLLVAGSVLLGVKVLAGADNTVSVWSLRGDLPAGTRVGAADVQPVAIRFTRAEDADRYLSADDALPDRRVLGRAVGAGELLPRDALVPAEAALVEVPLAVAVEDVPATVRVGSVVDVWVTPQAGSTSARTPPATRILEHVVVVAVPRGAETLAPSGSRQVIVGVPPDEADALGPALGRTSEGHVVITRRG